MVTRLHIDGKLVRYLRKGVLQQMGTALQILQAEVEQDTLDVSIYGRALARFDESRALLEVIGFDLGKGGDHDIDLDVERWRPLVITALENQHAIEVSRLSDAVADGVQLAPRDVPALGELVAELQQPKAAPSHRRPLIRWLRQRGGA